MSFKRSHVFEYVMEAAGCNDYSRAGDYLAKIKRFSIGRQLNLSTMRDHAQSDSFNYYLKSLAAFFEAYEGIKKNRFNWATVKLYYCCFYAIKSFILANDIFIMRINKFFEIKIRPGESFTNLSSAVHKNDHESAINYLVNEFGGSKLLSNNIRDDSTLEWMKKQRERVNYLQILYSEPDIPEVYEKIKDDIDRSGDDIIRKLMEDDYYVFDEEYAILAVPLKAITEAMRQLTERSIRGGIERHALEHMLSPFDEEKSKRFIKSRLMDPVFFLI